MYPKTSDLVFADDATILEMDFDFGCRTCFDCCLILSVQVLKYRTGCSKFLLQDIACVLFGQFVVGCTSEFSSLVSRFGNGLGSGTYLSTSLQIIINVMQL